MCSKKIEFISFSDAITSASFYKTVKKSCQECITRGKCIFVAWCVPSWEHLVKGKIIIMIFSLVDLVESYLLK